jgi:O-antigen/teichoic acid export membrane protein
MAAEGKVNATVLAVLNMGARGLGLVGRFGLTIFMAKYMRLSDVGVFGLVAGLAGLMPALSGLGLNFFLSRELVGQPPVAAGAMIRDRLAVTVITVGVLTLAALLAQTVHPFVAWSTIVPIILIVFLETIAFDLHMSLISLHRAFLANMLLFVRSSAWAFPVMAWGFLDPHARNLQVMLDAWVIGLLCYYLCLTLAFRGWPLREIRQTRVDWPLMRGTITRGWLVYISDIGIAGTLYLDRYIVAHFLGLSKTGIYTLYWSVANGMHILVTAAVVQLAVPHLVAAFRESEDKWLGLLERQLLKIAVVVLPLSACIFIGSQFVLPFFGVTRLAENPALFIAMLVGIFIRLAADMLNYGLYSRKLDRPLMLINIGGLVLALALDCVLLALLGMTGAAVAMIATPSILFVLRFIVLKRSGAPVVFQRYLGGRARPVELGPEPPPA